MLPRTYQNLKLPTALLVSAMLGIVEGLRVHHGHKDIDNKGLKDIMMAISPNSLSEEQVESAAKQADAVMADPSFQEQLMAFEEQLKSEPKLQEWLEAVVANRSLHEKLEAYATHPRKSAAALLLLSKPSTAFHGLPFASSKRHSFNRLRDLAMMIPAETGHIAAVEPMAAEYVRPSSEHAVLTKHGGSPSTAMSLLLADEELSDQQKKFLADREKLKQTYDTDVESTYQTADQVEGKKGIYTTIVTALVVIAFVAPIVQYLYYTGGS